MTQKIKITNKIKLKMKLIHHNLNNIRNPLSFIYQTTRPSTYTRLHKRKKSMKSRNTTWHHSKSRIGSRYVHDNGDPLIKLSVDWSDGQSRVSSARAGHKAPIQNLFRARAEGHSESGALRFFCHGNGRVFKLDGEALRRRVPANVEGRRGRCPSGVTGSFLSLWF